MATVEKEVEFPPQGEISALIGGKIKEIMENRSQEIAVTEISGDYEGTEAEIYLGNKIDSNVKKILAENHSEVPDNLDDFELQSYYLEGDDIGTAKIYEHATQKQ